MCLRTGTNVRALWMWKWTFEFHKIRRNSWLADNLLAYQEGLCSMGLVKYYSYLYESLVKKGRWPTVWFSVYLRRYRCAMTQNGICARRCDLFQGTSQKIVSVHGRTKIYLFPVSQPAGQEAKLKPPWHKVEILTAHRGTFGVRMAVEWLAAFYKMALGLTGWCSCHCGSLVDAVVTGAHWLMQLSLGLTGWCRCHWGSLVDAVVTGAHWLMQVSLFTTKQIRVLSVASRGPSTERQPAATTPTRTLRWIQKRRAKARGLICQPQRQNYVR